MITSPPPGVITSDHQKCIDHCQKLLRGHISAVETYQIAIEKCDQPALVPELTRMKTDHEASVAELTNHIHSLGGEPEEGSGVWGSFTKLVEKAAATLGDHSAVQALAQGEKAGESDIQDALESGELSPTAETLYRDKLLPRVLEHQNALERLKEQRIA